jgi:uncharacterized RDD family membrane protein YckC
MLLAAAAPLSAQDLIAAGDAENLWIVRPAATGKGITVLHRRTADQPESRLQLTGGLTGTLIPGGAVAGEGFLWLFYADGSVQGLRVVEEVAGRRFSDIILPALPGGITVRSIAVTRTGAWALVRVEDAAALKAIDEPEQPGITWREKQKRHAPLAPARDVPSPKEDPAKPSATKDGAEPKAKDASPAEPDPAKTAPRPGAATPPPADTAAVKADRLLHLSTTSWENVDLPPDWNQNLPAWLVSPSPDAERPHLVTALNAEKSIRWQRWEKPEGKPAEKPQWISNTQALEAGVRQPPTSIHNQLCVVNRLNSPGKIELSVTLIRPERVTEVGTFSLPDTGPWAVTPLGEQLALVTADKDSALFMKRINNTGTSDANPIPLAIEPPSLGPVADVLVYVIVLALATPILILMWKRESGPMIPQLPRGTRIADLAPRGIAGLIDLAPCIALAMIVRGVSFEDLINGWPGRNGGWEGMLPGAMAIGVFVAHTFFSELFTARTLGKAVMGLRVTGLRGEPPDLWQVLARNIFKLLDLIAVLLLFFVAISPNRQRLGDVVARTLVVARGAGEGGPDDPKEEDGEKSDSPPDPRPKRTK